MHANMETQTRTRTKEHIPQMRANAVRSDREQLPKTISFLAMKRVRSEMQSEHATARLTRLRRGAKSTLDESKNFKKEVPEGPKKPSGGTGTQRLSEKPIFKR